LKADTVGGNSLLAIGFEIPANKGHFMWADAMRRISPQDERFVRLALPHKDYLFDLAKRLTGNITLAEDLFQDTYLKAFCAFDSFDGSSRCRAWLKKIMVNTYINMYNRKRKVIFHFPDNDEISNYPDSEKKIYPVRERIDQETLLKNFTTDETRKSLLQLPAEYRQTIILYDMLGFSYKEIADILSTPMGTVKSRLFRGRQLLKESLTKQNNGISNNKPKQPI